MLLGQHGKDGLKTLRDGAPVLIVAEPAELRTSLRAMLRAIGCTELADCDGRHAMAALRAAPFALVIADLATGETAGLDLLRTVRAEAMLATLPVLLVAAAPTASMVMAVKQLGRAGCLAKPFTLAMLTRSVALALRQAGSEPAALDAAGGAAELRAGVAVLMRMLEQRLAAAELALDGDTLQLLRSYLDRAGELGLGRRYSLAFESLCLALHAGLPAELAPVRAMARDATRVPARAPRRELRRFRRFSTPALQVGMLGQPYRTLDWSANGLALAQYSGTLAAGHAVEATIRIEGGGSGAALFREPLLIVRNNSATGRLSARFQPRSWTSLKLMEQLIHRRIGAASGLAA